MPLENNLRAMRADHGWTQESLARAVGVTRQTIHAIEKGGYEPSVRLALELARALSVRVDELFWLGGTTKEGS
ncbi:MAG: helix-turn-helix transcriptional regulator [Candidatus Bipolaricaulis sp.]|nr:helix-turn-helix transcriptional regulator [Candidatus Bipolaricaulis sp.]